MQREAIIFDVVSPECFAMHARLENWARWVKSGSRLGGASSPMFRLYRSSFARSREPVSAAPTPDEIDGLAIERAVRELPERQREAVRWSYVAPYISPGKVARYLAVRVSDLPQYVREGQEMLLAARV